MVNEREKQILNKYESKGWETIRCGAPDFLFLKIKNKQIKYHIFVEVKSYNTNLSYEQFIWKKVLEDLGAKYKIEIVR